MALNAGAIRFNTDSSQMEIYDGNQWTGILGDSPELRTGGTRLLFMGGTDGSSTVDVIQFVNVETTGNATDFGNLNSNSKSGAGCSDRTRGLLQLGYSSPSYQNNISYITMATTGDALDFGDFTGVSGLGAACDSSTRGVFARGFDSNYYLNTLEYVTISTLGDATDFGDLTRSGVHSIMYSNATRGVCHCGYQYPASPNFMNIIDFITIASTGNAQDFGDSFLGGFGCGGASPTRGVAGGGYFANAPTGETGGFTNIIDFIEIATTGNSKDFGDLTNTVRHIKGESNGHGGL